MSQTPDTTIRFQNIHLHGMFVCIAGIVGCFAAGLLPPFNAATNSATQFFAMVLYFAGGAAFPALVVKSMVDRRWSVVAYGIPVVLFTAYAGFKLVLMIGA